MSINSFSSVQSFISKNKVVNQSSLLSPYLIVWYKFNGNLNNSAPNNLGKNNGTAISTGGGSQTLTTISPSLSNNTTITNMCIFNGGGTSGGLVTYIDYGTISNLILSQGFTICMFIYNTKTSGGEAYIHILNQTASNIGNGNFDGGMNIYQNPFNAYRTFGFNNYGSVNYATINQNTWAHFAVTLKTNNTYSVYLNGVLTLSNLTNVGTYPTSTTFTNNLLGWYSPGGGHNSFKGNIADYRLYNTNLTGDQILAIYNGTL